MTVHSLKIWPEFFEAIKSGKKTFEIRKGVFLENEILFFREYDSVKQEFTGRTLSCRITYVFDGGRFVTGTGVRIP